MVIHSVERGKNLNGSSFKYHIPTAESQVSEPLALVKVEEVMVPGMSQEIVTSRYCGKMESYHVVYQLPIPINVRAEVEWIQECMKHLNWCSVSSVDKSLQLPVIFS